jgi:hypothetical protein
MEYDADLQLADGEIAIALGVHGADLYPPILTVPQAAALAQVPLGTIRDWRSRGLLADCSHKCGREVRIWRDRFIKHLFGGKQQKHASKKPQRKI